jgi:ubiquinone/menaquinone biosynthesis C-methylase UbiE
VEIVSELKSFYEEWAAAREGRPEVQDYERRAAAWKWANLELLIRSAGDPPGSILEFGCGSGEMLERAAAAFPDATVQGIDLAERMIAMASARLPTGRFVAGGVEALATWPEPVDLVLAIDILEHLEDPLPAARAMARVGRCIALKIPLERRVIRLGLRRQEPGPAHHIAGHLHFWTLGESRALLAAAGLGIVAEKCVDPPESIRYHPSTRLGRTPAARGHGGWLAPLRRAHSAFEERLERWSCRSQPRLHRLLFGSSHFVVARPFRE